jgi:hypothetical protein
MRNTMRVASAVVAVLLGACKGDSKSNAPAPKPAAPEPAAQPPPPVVEAPPTKPATATCCSTDASTAVVQRGACTTPRPWTDCGGVDATNAPLLEKTLDAQWDGTPFPDVIVWPHADQGPTLLRVRVDGETAHLEYMHANKWHELGVAEINPARGGNATLQRKADDTVVFTSSMNAASQDEGGAHAYLLAANAKDGTVKATKKWAGSDLDKRPAWSR